MLDLLLTAIVWSTQSPIAEAAVSGGSGHACQSSPAPRVDQNRAAPRVWITDVQDAALMSPHDLRGQRLSVRDLVVDSIDAHGFWILVGDPECRMFVVPAEGSLIRVAPGELIDLQGEFRRASPADSRGEATRVFIYAYTVRRSPEGS